ncbi:histidinol dehydrogenase [Desmospora activa]|uniref:histidinol dehydrogenase n=1 Tax=Desmospora activa TaxID=500615 RepID=UPI000D31DB2F|nr:histidinol dehydrogenase [Desmospora activa]
MSIVKADELDIRRREETGSPEEERMVREVIRHVQHKGDTALAAYTRRFDKVEVTETLVSAVEMEDAYQQVEPAFINALQTAAAKIRAYHERQKRTSWMETETDGTVLGQLVLPLERVGVYVPGGRAAYPSTVLMTVIPAQVAGVEEVVITTPPQADGKIDATTLVAAREAGVERIFKVGGAQAIAALAFGTETIPRVDKICGPGNRYVTLAKRLVYGQVDIDMIAGPSEIVVIADDSADAAWVAADLLSQAEHDPMASAVLLTPSQTLAAAVTRELISQCERLPRREIAAQSLREHGAIAITVDVAEAVATANRLAPEHLQLMVEDPWSWVGQVRHAGALFLGHWSPEALGDYVAGPSHVLPTNGTARFSSPLGVDDFTKKTSLIAASRDMIQRDGQTVVTLAEAEGLSAHAASIRVRLEKEDTHG